MTIRKPTIGTAAALLAGFMSVGPTVAAAQSAPPAQTAPQATVTEQDIRAYAEAAVEVQEISAKWQPRIADAQQQQKVTEAESLQQEAQQEMVEAVQDKGLTVQQYNDIYRVAQADPQVRDKITRHMETVR